MPRDLCRVIRPVFSPSAYPGEENVLRHVQVNRGLRAHASFLADFPGRFRLRQRAGEPVEHVTALLFRRRDHVVFDQAQHEIVRDEVTGLKVAAQPFPDRRLPGRFLAEDLTA